MFLGCSVGFPYQSVSPSQIFPLILNIFSLSYLDETSYIDSFWDEICNVCNFLPRDFPLPPKPFPLILNTFPMSDLDETWYLD